MRLILAALLCVGLLVVAAGCNVIGAAAYAASGGAKVQPEYKLQNRSTLVLVENYVNPDLYVLPADRLQRDITSELTDAKSATFVAPEKTNELKSSDPTDYRKMNIPAVGRAVGAKQVVYVNLVQFAVDAPTGGERFVGRAEAHVKVVDSETGRTLWPPDSSDGRVVKVETRITEDVDDTKRGVMEDQLCQNFGQKIARLFHETNLADETVDEAASR